jgi:hypothetical protein
MRTSSQMLAWTTSMGLQGMPRMLSTSDWGCVDFDVLLLAFMIDFKSVHSSNKFTKLRAEDGRYEDTRWVVTHIRKVDQCSIRVGPQPLNKSSKRIQRSNYLRFTSPLTANLGAPLPSMTHYMLVDRAIQHDPQYFEGWAIHAPTRITQSNMLWPLKQVDFGRSSREGDNKRVCQEKRRFGVLGIAPTVKY